MRFFNDKKRTRAFFIEYLGTVREWLETAPNENVDFNILDRWRYMVKLRCLMAQERYDEAWNLSVKLDQYFRQYYRICFGLENMLLQAVISYRLQREQWRESTVQHVISH